MYTNNKQLNGYSNILLALTVRLTSNRAYTFNNKIIRDCAINMTKKDTVSLMVNQCMKFTVVQSTMLLRVGNPSTTVNALLRSTRLAPSHAGRCQRT